MALNDLPGAGAGVTFWLNVEQRRALRTWSLVLAGPALLAVVVLIVVLLTWGFGTAVPLQRVIWVGTIAVVLALLIFLPLATYAAETSLRSFKGSAGGVSFEATGGDAATVTATVANAAGDTATASVPIAKGDEV